jgi:hypothetical protein
MHDDTTRVHGRPYVNDSFIAVNAVFTREGIVTGFFANEQATSEIFKYGAIPKFVLAGEIFGDNIEDRFGHISCNLFLLWLVWFIAITPFP